MAIDRAATLRQAETFLRAGRIDAAVAEYERVVAEYPDDWSTANALGDLYARSGDPDKAIVLYERIAGHLLGRGPGRSTGRLPRQIPSPLHLIEAAADASLESVVHAAQVALADAYLAEGRAEEARVLAEDLVARDRRDPANVARLRRALELLQVPDVEGLVAAAVNSAGVDHLALLVSRSSPVLPAAEAENEDEDPLIAQIMSLGVIPSEKPGLPTPEPRAADDLAPEAGKDPPPDPITAPAPDLEEVFAGLRAEVNTEPAAVQFPQHRSVPAALLAQLHRNAGDLQSAIEWYERAAEAPPASPEDGRQLMYHLGDLLESMGETARALAVFIELETDTAGYRDVAERIRRLTGERVGG